MKREYEPQQLDAKDRLGLITDICVAYARRVFLERRERDTNPQIVQMRVHGELIDHWYYRSNEWVEQPYFIPQLLLQPYVGPANLAFPMFYRKGTYVVDTELTKIIEEQMAFK